VDADTVVATGETSPQDLDAPELTETTEEINQEETNEGPHENEQSPTEKVQAKIRSRKVKKAS
jgi:hypothetical protein